MTLLAILLVTLSAITHAGWNFICKYKSASGGAFFLILTIVTVAALCPVFFLYGSVYASLGMSFWIMIILTGVCQTGYFVGLENAYRSGEISVAYPLTRSLPVLFLPIVTGLLHLGSFPTQTALFGMVLVFLGCMILPRQKLSELFQTASYRNKTFLLIVMTACFVTAYSAIDREGLRYLEKTGAFPSSFAHTLFYLAWEEASILVFLAIYVLSVPSECKKIKDYFSTEVWFPIAAAVLCSGGYLIFLFAMNLVSNVSYVIAFRQLGLPIGAVLGILFLKETCPALKIAGMILILAGLCLVAL